MSDTTPVPLKQLSRAGVSIWLDDLSRERLTSGNLADLVRSGAVVGVTTNPAIFHTSLSHGAAYESQLHELSLMGASVDEAVRSLTAFDVRWACDVLRESTTAPTGSTAESRSKSTPGSRTTRRPLLPRRSHCGGSSTGRTR